MCMCVLVCACTGMCVHKHVYVCVDKHVCVCVDKHVCVCGHVCVPCVHVMYVHIHVCIHVCVHVHTCV